MVDGVETEDWFASDFTLAEIKTLRAIQARSGRSTAYDGQFQIPTLDEVIALAKEQSAKTGRTIGIYPEVKHSTFHGSMSLVAPHHKPYDFVVKGDSRSFGDLVKPAGLDFIKTYADAVGPWKPYLVKTVNDGVERSGDSTLTLNDRRIDGSTGVIENAHARGLLVHTWTFRNDASGYGFKDPQAEMEYYMKLGVDGVFTDFPATGVAALNALR